MIQITVPKSRVYDSANNLFYTVEKDTLIQLEHSLISLQKWEAKWHKPFLGKGEKTLEETIDYIRCMCLTPNVKGDVFYCIPQTEMEKISEYIENPMTATWFSEERNGVKQKKKEIITAEIIYYWMISLGIPSEYKKWHLNQLLTLIRVINVKNTPKKKRSRREILEEHKRISDLNKQRFGVKE